MFFKFFSMLNVHVHPKADALQKYRKSRIWRIFLILLSIIYSFISNAESSFLSAMVLQRCYITSFLIDVLFYIFLIFKR